jgi:uncharacterized protein YjbJ (UPF0337 family)
MNKDRVEGKVKDIRGRVERQVGEWTDDPEKQVHGAAKQAEGKVQNAFGKVKDAANKTSDDAKAGEKDERVAERAEAEKDEEMRRRRAS